MVTDHEVIAEMLKREQKKLRESKRIYRKLKRSKVWAAFCFICLLAVVGGVSYGVFRYFRTGYTKELYAQELSYSQDYQQWKNHTFEDYYEKCLREEPNAAAANDGGEDADAYISSLKRQKLGLEEETFGAVSRFTNTTGYELDEYSIAGDGNSVIFPGAVLKGESLFQGSADYTLLPLERTSMHLTSNQSGGYSEQVEKADFRNVSEVLDECAKKSEGQSAKDWKYYTQVIRSSEELEANLGIKLPEDLGIEFGYGNKTETSSIAVIYRQTFYTVSAEPKERPSEYFQGDVDLTVFGDYEPAYVSSVDYGRMILVLIQGEMSEEELGAKVGACIEGVSIGAGLANIQTDTSLDSTIQQFGGKQKDVGMITDTSKKDIGLVEYWKTMWNGSEDTDTIENRINDFISTDEPAVNPVPIAYTLKYLTDNSYAPAMVISNRETMLAERSMIKKVRIAASEPVDWENVSDAACVLVSSNDTAYEFIWDSGSIGALQGKVLSDSWKEPQEVQLELGAYLPSGKKDINIGGRASALLDAIAGIKPVTVDVSISAY